MKRWLLAGAAMLTLGNAAEPELSSSRFGEFEVTAIQDAATTMRRTLFAALPEQEFRRLAGGDAAPASVNVFLLKRNGKQILADTGYGGSRGHGAPDASPGAQFHGAGGSAGICAVGG